MKKKLNIVIIISFIKYWVKILVKVIGYKIKGIKNRKERNKIFLRLYNCCYRKFKRI